MVTIAKEFQLGSDFPKIDYAMWRKQVEADLKGAPFDKRMFSRSYEGIELQSLYTEEIFPTADDPSGLPGYPPFVRGARPLGKALAGWDIRQEHAHPDPAVANAQSPRGSRWRRDLHRAAARRRGHAGPGCR